MGHRFWQAADGKNAVIAALFRVFCYLRIAERCVAVSPQNAKLFLSEPLGRKYRVSVDSPMPTPMLPTKKWTNYVALSERRIEGIFYQGNIKVILNQYVTVFSYSCCARRTSTSS